MNNFMMFLMNFLAYGIVFVIIVALVLVACFIGIKWRKSKDAKEKAALESSEAKAEV